MLKNIFKVFTLLTLLFTVNAHATIFFEQIPLNGGEAIQSNAEVDDISAAFSINDPSNLDTLTWWGSYDNLSSFTIKLTGTDNSYSFSDITGIMTPVNTGIADVDSAPIYRYDFTFSSPLSLAAGNYNLSIASNSESSPWYWSVSNVDGGGLAFKLDGSVSPVPEPEEWAMMMLGLPLMGFVARRRKSSDSNSLHPH